jgi:cob(I)alamin adenosyltransferase
MRVYTKTGDKGTTALIGGERVSKADPRVEAYGSVDELAAHLALLGDMMRNEGRLAHLADAIDTIQGDLMTVEALLATGTGAESRVTPLPPDTITRLENEIDAMSADLPPVKGFTLPGGHPIISQSHVCRTVCRRAERAVVRIGGETGGMTDGEAASQQYLNRLSDWLYVAGRRIVEILGLKEKYWMG